MEFSVGPETPLPGMGDHATVLTQVIFFLFSRQLCLFMLCVLFYLIDIKHESH